MLSRLSNGTSTPDALVLHENQRFGEEPYLSEDDFGFDFPDDLSVRSDVIFSVVSTSSSASSGGQRYYLSFALSFFSYLFQHTHNSEGGARQQTASCESRDRPQARLEVHAQISSAISSIQSFATHTNIHRGEEKSPKHVTPHTGHNAVRLPQLRSV